MNLDRDILEDIVDISKKYDYIEKVILFGSRARCENEPRSDIDLAVYSRGDIFDFIEDIEMNARTLLEFDFSHMEKVKDEFFVEQVVKDGVVIYDKFGV